jgi:hypothetical protein
LKPEWWGSPLAQEKYQGRKKTCDKRTYYYYYYYYYKERQNLLVD